MDWKSAEKNDKGLYKIPKRWLHVHYYEALNILFRFENSLRVFVYTVLKNELNSEWKNCSFSSGGEDSKTINSIAAKRINQAENFGYLGFAIASPVMHLTSGELIDLITANAHWPKFKSYFRGSREIIKNKLLEIGSVRNSIAHFRPIRPEDVELIKQNSRHVLLGVEECLTNIFNQQLRVPTNTVDPWYESISTLGTDHVVIIPHISNDGAWLNVRMAFKSPQLGKNSYGDDFYGFVMGNLNTPGLLLNHPLLASYVTYVSETIRYPILNESSDIDIRKEVNMVFLKSLFEANHDLIATELKDVLSKISEECELLLQDNLARGQIVESASINSYFHSKGGEEARWHHTFDSMWKGYEAHHPDEYWGSQQYVSDAVGGARRYPWMPVDISEQESFFD